MTIGNRIAETQRGARDELKQLANQVAADTLGVRLNPSV